MFLISLASTPSPVISSYVGALTSSSSIFYRPQSFTPDYQYFQALQVTVSTPGIYFFTSNSTIDTRGYFYQNSFDPSNSSANLVTDNDDSGGLLQFRIQVYLQSGRTYVLVVTTHREYIMGNFSVSAAGPAFASLTAITPSTSQPITIRKFLTGFLSTSKAHIVDGILKTQFMVILSLICFTYPLRKNSSSLLCTIHFNSECLRFF